MAAAPVASVLPPDAVVSPIQDLLVTAQSVVRLAYFILSWTLSLSAQLASFCTLTLPRVVYDILSWGATLTLTLNFTKVATTLILGGTVLSYIWKVRYLNRYTSLKEVSMRRGSMATRPDRLERVGTAQEGRRV